jgi:glutathione S-transferase
MVAARCRRSPRGMIMPQIDTKNEAVRKLSGLHLYHDPLSSCAMRVRMVLVEKDLPWASHVVDLSKMEHATPEFQSINPQGLVPTLIHDGRTYIESIDIIRYLDELKPAPSLLPADPNDRGAFDALIADADRAQTSLKALTHEFLFRGTGRYSGEEDLKKFANGHHNTWLVDFKRSFAARDAAWQSRVAKALADMGGHFRNLERRLAAGKWLAGESFTLADVAWTPQVHRMRLMEWPMTAFPQLSRWYSQLEQRPSFRQAVVDCEPPGARTTFANYVAQRRREGTSVADQLNRAAA